MNGIIPRGDNGWFLLAALNSPATNYIFKWLGKPKDNDYYEANKQFIAPLPVPRASAADRAGLTALAKGMQDRRTAQVHEQADLNERLESIARTNLPLDRMLVGVRTFAEINAAVPRSVDDRDRKRWTDDEHEADVEAAYARIDALIRADSEFSVVLRRGKLSFLIDEQEAARLFVSDAEGPLVEAQWRATAIGFSVTGKDDAERLVGRLRRVATDAPPAVAEQIVAIGRRLAERDSVLRDDEQQLHEMTCRLFGLSPAERKLVERGRV